MACGTSSTVCPGGHGQKRTGYYFRWDVREKKQTISVILGSALDGIFSWVVFDIATGGGS